MYQLVEIMPASREYRSKSVFHPPIFDGIEQIFRHRIQSSLLECLEIRIPDMGGFMVDKAPDQKQQLFPTVYGQ